MKPVLMELGGHAPVIVCDDVDPVATAVISASRKARNAGQVCTSPTRFFVQESIYKKFAQTFAEKAQSVVVGNGFERSTQMGPLANHRRVEAMEALVADAKEKGARILAGGERVGNRGYTFRSPSSPIFRMRRERCEKSRLVRSRLSRRWPPLMKRSRKPIRCRSALLPTPLRIPQAGLIA